MYFSRNLIEEKNILRAAEGIWTPDLLITNQPLHQLSYGGIPGPEIRYDIKKLSMGYSVTSFYFYPLHDANDLRSG